MDTINNNSIDTNSVDKKKKSFLPKLLIALSSLFSIVGFGLAILPNHYKSARAVSYDDENYSIELSLFEISDYTFSNYARVIDYSSYSNYITITYNESTYTYMSFSNNSYHNGGYQIKLPFYTNGGINDTDKFLLKNNGSTFDFEYGLTINYTSDSYDVFKQAIEQDIADNQPYEPNNFLLDAITLLVSPIVLIATGMGTGISSTISSLIYYNGAMSPFMAVIFIFGGLALAFGLSRWIVNLLSSLGKRNR